MRAACVPLIPLLLCAGVDHDWTPAVMCGLRSSACGVGWRCYGNSACGVRWRCFGNSACGVGWRCFGNSTTGDRGSKKPRHCLLELRFHINKLVCAIPAVVLPFAVVGRITKKPNHVS